MLKGFVATWRFENTAIYRTAAAGRSKWLLEPARSRRSARNGCSSPLGAAVALEMALEMAARARLGAAGALGIAARARLGVAGALEMAARAASESLGRSKWPLEPASEPLGRSESLREPASEPLGRSK